MNKKILLVAPNPAFEKISRLLSGWDYQVHGPASSIEEATNQANQIGPDLILFDFQVLPNQDMGDYPSFQSFGDKPIIGIIDTAKAKKLRLDCMPGLVSLLVKPVYLQQLRTSIEIVFYRQSIEQDIRATNERFALVERATQDGIFDWNLITGKVFFSPRWLDQVGLNTTKVDGSPEVWFNCIHPEDRQQFQQDLMIHLKGTGILFEEEYRVINKDDGISWMLVRAVTSRDESGVATRFTGSQSDITPRKIVEARHIYDALHDPLTGLPNRVLFMDRLGFRLDHSRRYTEVPFAVLYMDLDRFKVVNDTLGHAAGDQLLMTTAVRIEQCLRPEDTVSRLSGDEFAIIINEVHDVEEAIKISDRIRSRLVTTTLLGSIERSPTASIGIVICNKNYENPENILRDADLAMYRAKTLGRNRHQIFDEAMFTGAMAQLQMEVELKRAVARGEWQILYQPIIALETNKTIGLEALLRWLNPQRGVVFPLEFIRLAEETGYIVPIGLFVLRTACKQVKAWRNDGYKDLWVSVNISGRQFQAENLVDMIRGVLEETQLPPGGLRLEVTESVAMQDIEYTIRVLKELEDLGVYTLLDDFGTGYSSLSYLKRFPLKILKIDQSFIQDIRVNQNSEAITEAIIMMARSLNLEVIAEGVEKEDQISFLRALLCANGQGYYYSHPLTAEKLSQIFLDVNNLVIQKP